MEHYFENTKSLDQKRNLAQELGEMLAISLGQKEIIAKLVKTTPPLDSLLKDKNNFIQSDRYFAKNSGEVEYAKEEIKSDAGRLKFFHELGHKLMEHSGESSDRENLENERLAWLYAVGMLKREKIKLSEELIRSILDSFETYKKYLESHNVCPACGGKNIKEWAPQEYTCNDCFCDW